MTFAYKSEHFASKATQTSLRAPRVAVIPQYKLRKPIRASAVERRRIAALFLKEIRERSFNNIADKVVKDTQYTSSPSSMRKTPSFENLVRLGDFATRRLLSRIRRGEVRLVWLIALRAINDENPVPEYSRGIVNEMADAWLQWGQQRGLV